MRTTGGALLGVLASGAVTVAACGMAPTANATCAAFFGFNNGGGCASSPTSIAIAVGTGAQAYAEGMLGAAFAIGTNSIASIPSTGRNFLNMATAVGVDTLAEAGGAVTGALAAGQSVSALASIGLPSYLPVANFAINLSMSPTNNLSVAEGVGNVSVNLFGSGAGQDVRAIGLGNVAINVGGTSNAVRASVGTSNRAYASFAFNVGGSGNLVQAGAGPLAIAGAFNQFGATVTPIRPRDQSLHPAGARRCGARPQDPYGRRQSRHCQDRARNTVGLSDTSEDRCSRGRREPQEIEAPKL
ncbi:hypothetical protein H7J51_07030 [Mycobacterium crocinum]|uniref:PPE family protein n=1 Tax=Mycolicibacterium crocinum TaxID=388459 RepID=A0ABY3TKY1_9MYCO|nr:hypothetical protein [Mycolicibacterium crocinum]MCV7215034.1 hypothetical protein [Mycolicibacterium crocinum]ULN42097.1 hypothetical protein MI149_02925 [Mycolicibacterium crocinum]